MLDTKIYQTIFDELKKYLPPKWDKLIIYLEYGESYYSFSFYIKTGDTFTKCYDIGYISENDLISSFDKIDKVVAQERKKYSQRLWSNMTMVVDPSGDMETHFDYTDLQEIAYQHKKDWKKQYFK